MPSVRKFLAGVFVFALCMNFMAWGIENNGGAYAGNFVWEIANVYLVLQRFLLSASVFVLTIVMSIRLSPSQCSDEMCVGKEQQHELKVDFSKYHLPVNALDTPLKTSESRTSNIEAPQVKHAEAFKTPSKPIKEITKEDIRKRVLEELTGRSD